MVILDNELKQFEAFIDQEGDDLWKAAAVSFTDQWVEVVSEHSAVFLTKY